MDVSKWMFRIAGVATLALIPGWILLPLFYVEPLPPVNLRLPSPGVTADGSVSIPHPGVTYVADLATYEDEVFAYLMFSQTRNSGRFPAENLWLKWDRSGDNGAYTLVLRLSDDQAEAIARAAELKSEGATKQYQWRGVSRKAAERMAAQTRLFDAAYNLPVRQTFEDLPKRRLRALTHRFIRFKSNIDPRVQKKIEPVPEVLDRLQAERLAGDIFAVAEFYDIPLDVFLGIGAIENNYMNVRGDRENSTWKRRPAKDDIILERRGGRVRVLNDSAGVWQITRETLRYTHRLYLKDTRDYSKLPEHLRPPKTLVMNELNPEVLTTYAGLLLRDLLDRFDGDVSLAVGAYNGGVKNPNMRYEQWVRNAAEHARRVVEKAAALGDRSVVDTVWLSAP